MKITVERISSGPESTIGVLYVDDRFACFTCEDPFQHKKIKGRTRIPAGNYQVLLRTEGGMHENYVHRFSFHRGMLELQNVPGFTYIYIHVGNSPSDTEGCILVGASCESWESGGGRVLFSTSAYSDVYPRVVSAARSKQLYLEIIDRDRKETSDVNGLS